MILRAWRLSSGLPYDGLPPLADYDEALHLADRYMFELDPHAIPQKENEEAEAWKKRKGRHVFWGILRVHWRAMVGLTALLVANLVSDFSRPLAINKLLRCVESTSLLFVSFVERAVARRVLRRLTC